MGLLFGVIIILYCIWLVVIVYAAIMYVSYSREHKKGESYFYCTFLDFFFDIDALPFFVCAFNCFMSVYSVVIAILFFGEFVVNFLN